MPNNGSIRVSHFGFLPDKREVFCYTLCNRLGMELSIINFGASITSLKIPLSGNRVTDVVLGFATLEDYLHSYRMENRPYIGAVVGRYAGRIAHGRFPLHHHNIELTKNFHAHQLHGGFEGFSRAYWQLTGMNEEDNPSVSLQYISPDLEENFPGELTTEVTYTLSETGEISIVYKATSSEDTVINLTQHSYFNLDGHDGHVTDQELFIASDRILETDQDLIPTGNFIDLTGHPFDFRTTKKCPLQIDTSFVLDKILPVQASLCSQKNRLLMTVSTSQPSVHIYVGGDCGGQVKGKDSVDYRSDSGICFETQHFPDSPNHPDFPSTVLRKGETYHHETRFAFKYI